MVLGVFNLSACYEDTIMNDRCLFIDLLSDSLSLAQNDRR